MTLGLKSADQRIFALSESFLFGWNPLVDEDWIDEWSTCWTVRRLWRASCPTLEFCNFSQGFEVPRWLEPARHQMRLISVQMTNLNFTVVRVSVDVKWWITQDYYHHNVIIIFCLVIWLSWVSLTDLVKVVVCAY